MHHHVELAAEVIENHHFVREHQQDIGIAELIRVGTIGQFGLDVAHGVVAEVTDQTTGELGQPIDIRHPIASLKGLDKGQRVLDGLLLDHHMVGSDRHLALAYAEYCPCRQADNGVTPPLLAALHRFEQVGVGRVGQLEVGGKRGVEVGQHLAHQRDAVVAGLGKRSELFRSHETSPSGQMERTNEKR